MADDAAIDDSVVEVVPATVDRFDDIATMLNPRGHPQACWCLAWRRPSKQHPTQGGDHLRELTGQEPAPGMLGYLGGEVVGWLGFSPKSLAPTLQRSRVLPRGEPESWPTTWAVMCFVVRVCYRRRGVARAMLDGAVTYAFENGAEVIEGFPVDSGGGRVPVSAAYVGTVDLFESAGFTVAEPTQATSDRRVRWLVRHTRRS